MLVLCLIEIRVLDDLPTLLHQLCRWRFEPHEEAMSPDVAFATLEKLEISGPICRVIASPTVLGSSE